MRRAAAIILLAAAFVAPLSAATRYDPRLRFRTITTARFFIHYHQGEERQARRLARIAEDVASQLDATLGRADGRVHVILVDQTDLSNGWATPVPENIIEITAAAPSGESVIGNTDDWLRIVFTHEYTHVVHLGRRAGWIGALRRVFGRQPLLFPNLFQPLWQIEGIATYEETAQTRQGRVAAGDFRLLLADAAAQGRFEPIDRANGGLVDWPSGHAPYLYGGFFHAFLEERYGPGSLRRLTDETARRLPYLGARAYKKVFGKSLGSLWTDFEAASRRAARLPETSATRLTRHGFNVRGPRFAAGHRILYAVSNPHGFPALMELAPGREPRRIMDRYLGNRVAAHGALIVFDQLEYVRNVGLQSDLYARLADGPVTWRLTNEARAADPDLSPDGQTIVCTIQGPDRRGLALLPAPSVRGVRMVPTPLVSEAETHFASPRWSPDGRWIAAERRQRGGATEIVLVDVATRAIRALPAPGSRNVSPAWMPDGRRVVFASAVGETPFAIYSVDITTGALARLQGAGASAQSPDVSADGSTIVFVGYTSDGYDLFSMKLDAPRWRPADPVPVSTAAAPPDTADAGTDRAYSPLRTLLPRLWSPIVQSDGDDLVIGAATVGADVLGRHAYGVSAGWSTTRGRPDWWAAYAYDRWRPTFFADISDDSDAWLDGNIRTQELNAGALVPFRRVRKTQTAIAAFNASTDTIVCTECGPIPAGRVSRRSLRVGWTFDSARTYGYSISQEDGTAASLSVESTVAGLGSDGDAGAAVLDVRQYVRAIPRHGVLAARVAGAATWGDEDVRRAFTAGGSGAPGSGVRFGSDAVGLLRGFDESERAGRHVAVANLDYRVPLVRVERGVGTLPVFLRTVHAAAFVDAGTTWIRRFDRNDLRVSAGFEIAADTVLGYALPVTFAGGGAWRRDPGGRERGFTIFGRIGRAY